MSPVAELCVTIFTGFLGGHYFVKGKVGLGILYLLTFGLFGIGWIVDCVKAAMKVYTISKSKTEKEQTETGNFLWVTGVHYYLDNIQKLATLNREYSASADEIISHGKAGRRIFKYYYADIPVELIPEPQNPHDKNAIAVHIAGELVGYVGRDDNTKVLSALQKGCIGYVAAFVSGGPYKVVSLNGDVEQLENAISIKLQIGYQ